MKKMLMGLSLAACLATAAQAMDGDERARQMALYNAQVNGGAQITTTTTTAPVAMPSVPTNPPVPVATPITTPPVTVPVTGPMGAPSITASKTGPSRSMPVTDAPMAATMTTTTSVTAPAPTATASPMAVATVGQMSPLNDDGTPMHVKPDAGTLGQTSARADQIASLNAGTAGASAQERQMQAWREWKSANNGAGAATPAPFVPQQVQTTTTVTTGVAPAPAYVQTKAYAPAPMAMAQQPAQPMPAAPQMAMAQQPAPVAPAAPMVEPAAAGNAPSPFEQTQRGPRDRTPAFGVATGQSQSSGFGFNE